MAATGENNWPSTGKTNRPLTKDHAVTVLVCDDTLTGSRTPLCRTLPRHHSIQMFEGYAGTSESGFRAEVEAEEALARGEHLLAMIDRHEHAELVGPASDEAERRLDELGERASFAGTVTTDRRRLLRIMSRHDPAVYPGKYATCVYNHSKALCRARANADAPDLTDCRPLACANVALTPDNRAAWRAELDVIEADLSARPLLPPLIVDSLERRRGQVQHFLNRHEDQQ